MSAKRPHYKSRTGCSQCKQRKVKCDERSPACANCERYKSTCSYLQRPPLEHPRPLAPRTSLPNTTTNPQNPSELIYFEHPAPPLLPKLIPKITQTIIPKTLDPLPLQFSILDLELLHFYTHQTSTEILGAHITGTRIWQTVAVQIGFEHRFLLHELLSFSALHLATIHATNTSLSQKYRNAAIAHYAKSITRFRKEMLNLTEENCHACFACAAILGVHAWAVHGERGANLFFPGEEDGVWAGPGEGIPWYKLHRGANEVLKSVFHWIREGPLWDMIRPWMHLKVDDPTPLHGSDKLQIDSIATCWTNPPPTTNRNTNPPLTCEQVSVLETTLQTLRRVFSITTMLKIEIGDGAATMSWIMLIPEAFCKMVEEKLPQALILIAVYCVLLNRLDGFWWIKGKATNLLESIERELPVGEGWEKWLTWPKGEIERKLERERRDRKGVGLRDLGVLLDDVQSSFYHPGRTGA